MANFINRVTFKFIILVCIEWANKKTSHPMVSNYKCIATLCLHPFPELGSVKSNKIIAQNHFMLAFSLHYTIFWPHFFLISYLLCHNTSIANTIQANTVISNNSKNAGAAWPRASARGLIPEQAGILPAKRVRITFMWPRSVRRSKL